MALVVLRQWPEPQQLHPVVKRLAAVVAAEILLATERAAERCKHLLEELRLLVVLALEPTEQPSRVTVPLAVVAEVPELKEAMAEPTVAVVAVVEAQLLAV